MTNIPATNCDLCHITSVTQVTFTETGGQPFDKFDLYQF